MKILFDKHTLQMTENYTKAGILVMDMADIYVDGFFSKKPWKKKTIKLNEECYGPIMRN